MKEEEAKFVQKSKQAFINLGERDEIIKWDEDKNEKEKVASTFWDTRFGLKALKQFITKMILNQRAIFKNVSL